MSNIKTTVDLGQFRKDMKALGYKVSIRTMSEFKAAKVSNENGVINSGNVFSPEHFEAHKSFYDYKNSTKVRDGDWIVVF